MLIGPPPPPGIRRARNVPNTQPVFAPVVAAPIAAPIATATIPITPTIPVAVPTIPPTPSMLPTITIILNTPLKAPATPIQTIIPTHTAEATYTPKQTPKNVVKSSVVPKSKPSQRSSSSDANSKAIDLKIPSYLIALVAISSVLVILSLIIAIRYKMKINAKSSKTDLSTFPVRNAASIAVNTPNYQMVRTEFTGSVASEPNQYLFAKTNLEQRPRDSICNYKETTSLFDSTNPSSSEYSSEYSFDCPTGRGSSYYQTNASYSILSYGSTPMSLDSDHYSEYTMSTMHPKTRNSNALYADFEFEESLYSGSMYSRM